MAKVLMVIAQDNFRDEEYFDTKEAIESAGHSVETASQGLSEAKGMLGRTATPDLVLSDAKADDYDAIVFVGGSGASAFFDDSKAKSLAKEAADSGKVVAAICIAPTILANAGVLEGKKATVFKDGGLIENLKAKGAEYTGESVTSDGKVITGEGPHSAKEFGKKIAEALG